MRLVSGCPVSTAAYAQVISLLHKQGCTNMHPGGHPLGIVYGKMLFRSLSNSQVTAFRKQFGERMGTCSRDVLGRGVDRIEHLP